MSVSDIQGRLRLVPEPEVHAPVAMSYAASADEVVSRMRAAQADWSAMPLRLRLRCLRRFRGLLAAHADEVTDSVRRRPKAQTLAGEIMPLLDACRFIEREALAVLATRRPRARGFPAPGRVHVTIEREPLGVVLIIAPGNYGLMLAAVQALQALAAGNAVIIKPAPGAQAALAQFAALLVHGGVPGDVICVVDESLDTARAFVDSAVDHVVFTGSNQAGRNVLARAYAGLKPAALELSGWDPCIVLDDADPDLVAAAIAFALRFNRGQTCVAPRRVLVSAGLRAKLEQRLVARLADSKEAVFDAEVGSRAAGTIAEAITRGARLVAGRIGDGTASASMSLAASSAVRGPVVLAGVSEDMSVWNTEVFGPLVMIAEYQDLNAAIAMANRSEYALGASVFGSRHTALAVARRLQAGLVTVNDVIFPLADPQVPLAPRGASGFGVTRGAEGLVAMTRPKVFTRPRAARALRRAYDLEPPAAVLLAYARLTHGAGIAMRLRALKDLLSAGWRAVRHRGFDDERHGVTGS